MAAIDTMNKMLDTSNDTISNFSNMLDFASEKLEKINNAGESAMVFKDQVVEASNSIISTFSDIYNGDFEIPESIMGSGEIVIEGISGILANPEIDSEGVKSAINEMMVEITGFENIPQPLFDIAYTGAEKFITDMGLMEPLISGVSDAMDLYNGFLYAGEIYQKGLNAVEKINIGIQTAQGIASALKNKTTIAEAASTGELTVAQWALNSAFLASPITWIIAGIVALIAAVYGIVAAINHFTGSTISATGIIMGALNVAVSFVGNLFMGLFEMVLGIIDGFVNGFTALSDFLGNIFNDPVGAIINLFFDMVDVVLSSIEKIASGIDIVMGSDLAGTVSGWRSDLELTAKTVTDKYGNGTYKTDSVKSNLADSFNFERLDYKESYDKGYSFGEELESKFNMDDLFSENSPFDFNSEFTERSDENLTTAAMANSMVPNEEEIKYLRSSATSDNVDRYSSAEINIDMPVNATINSEMDIDAVIEHLNTGVMEAMNNAMEGVHV